MQSIYYFTHEIKFVFSQTSHPSAIFASTAVLKAHVGGLL